MAAAPKTQKTTASVTAFLDTVENERRRADAKAVLKLMKAVTGEKAVMWGPAIVGFGEYRSNTGPWPIVAFSPRKAALVLYIKPDAAGVAPLLGKLGKHKLSGGCLHLTNMADVDAAVLGEVIGKTVAAMKKAHGLA